MLNVFPVYDQNACAVDGHDEHDQHKIIYSEVSLCRMETVKRVSRVDEQLANHNIILILLY